MTAPTRSSVPAGPITAAEGNPGLLKRSLSAARILLLCLLVILLPAALYYYVFIQNQIAYRDERAFRSLREVEAQLQQAMEAARAYTQFAPTTTFHAQLAQLANQRGWLTNPNDVVAAPADVSSAVNEWLSRKAPEHIGEFLQQISSEQSLDKSLTPESLSQYLGNELLAALTTMQGDGEFSAETLASYRTLLQVRKDESIVRYAERISNGLRCEMPADDPQSRPLDRRWPYRGDLCELFQDPVFTDVERERKALAFLLQRASDVCKANAATHHDTCALTNLAAWIPQQSEAAEQLASRMHAGLTVVSAPPPIAFGKHLEGCQQPGGVHVAFWQHQSNRDSRARIYHCGEQRMKLAVDIEFGAFLNQRTWFDALDGIYVANSDGKVLLNLGKHETSLAVDSMYRIPTVLPRLQDLSALLKTEEVGAGAKPTLTAIGPTIKAVTLEGHEVYAYIHQMTVPVQVCADRTPACQRETLLIVGARLTDDLSAANSLAPGSYLLWLCVLLIALLAWPWLSLLFSQHLLAIAPGTLRALVLSLLLTAVPVGVGLWAYLSYHQSVALLTERAFTLANAMEASWQQELRQAFTALHNNRGVLDDLAEVSAYAKTGNNWKEFASPTPELEVVTARDPNADQNISYQCYRVAGTAQLASKRRACVAERDACAVAPDWLDNSDAAIAGESSVTATDTDAGSVPDTPPAEAAAAEVSESEPTDTDAYSTPYPDEGCPRTPRELPGLVTTFEFEPDGAILGPVLQRSQLLPAYGRQVSSRGRQYVERLRNRTAWPWLDRPSTDNQPADNPQTENHSLQQLPAQFVVERLFSRTDARLITQLAARFEQGNDKVGLGGNVAAHSFEFAMVPPGFTYAVIDNDSGTTLFHSDHNRAMTENLFDESHHNSRLHAAINYGTRDSFRGRYHGKRVLYAVQPLTDVPWSIVIIADLEIVQLALVNISLLTLVLVLLPLAALATCYLAARFMRRRSAWAWPQWQHRLQYGPLAVMLTGHLLLGWFALSALKGRSLYVAVALLVVATVTASSGQLIRASKLSRQGTSGRVANRIWRLLSIGMPDTSCELSRWQLLMYGLTLLLHVFLLALVVRTGIMLSVFSTAILLLFCHGIQIVQLRQLAACPDPADTGLASFTAGEQRRFRRHYQLWAMLFVANVIWIPTAVFLHQCGWSIERRLEHIAGVALANRFADRQQQLQELGNVLYPDRFELGEKFRLPAAVERQLLREFPQVSGVRHYRYGDQKKPDDTAHSCRPRTESSPGFVQWAFELAGNLTTEQSALLAAGTARIQADKMRYPAGDLDANTSCVNDARQSGESFAADVPTLSLLPGYRLLLILLVCCVMTYLGIRVLLQTMLASSFDNEVLGSMLPPLPATWQAIDDLAVRDLLRHELVPLSASMQQHLVERLDTGQALPELVRQSGQLVQHWYETQWQQLSEQERQMLYLIAQHRYPLHSHREVLQSLREKQLVLLEPHPVISSKSLQAFVLNAPSETEQQQWQQLPQNDLWRTLQYPLGLAIVLILIWVAYTGGDLSKLLVGAITSVVSILTAARQAHQMLKTS